MSSVAPTNSAIVTDYKARTPASGALFERARKVLPSGITHDARYLDPYSIHVARAKGPRKWDVDGNEYVDYFGGHGAMLLGHSHPAVIEAVKRQMDLGTHYGSSHELEVRWAELVCELTPCAEKVRFTASGTEASHMAIRLARAHTGKDKIVRFAGHFHGWHDNVAAGATSHYDGTTTPGVPQGVADLTILMPSDDVSKTVKLLEERDDIAMVMFEPSGASWGQVPLPPGFVQAIREVTARRGVVMLMDEVITGFRWSSGGAQKALGITPDLCILAKIVAGGLPGGCVAGRADILAHLEFRPGQPKMKHPGTFNANPLSASAGIAALRLVATGEPCRRATEIGRLLRGRLNALFAERDADWIVYGEFSFFRLLPRYRGPRPDGDDFIPYDGDLNKLDGPRDVWLTQALRLGMLLHGVDFFGMGGMTTAAHTEEDVERTVAAMAGTLDLLGEEGERGA
jgi:glutamate-1-semialdehyde 2,1-aminomutase